MAYVNEYEEIAKLENPEYIKSLPDFEYGKGKIPPLKAYRKLSVDSLNEAMTLAKIGAVMGDKVVPGQKLYFTQALLMGAITSKNPKYRSIMMICPTRYGKSYLTGLAGIGAAAVLNREVRIGGATRDKADIVMEKIINFMPNTSMEIQNGMVIGDTDANVNKKIARLSTQTSREALSWKTGGSIKMFTMSETSKNRDVAGAGAIGIGGDMQIYDECVDGDTEILTEAGFIKFKDLPDGIKVAQYNLSGQIEFVTPIKVTRQPAVPRKAYAVSLRKGKEPIIMTTNHRQPLLWKGETVPRIQEIKDIKFTKNKTLIQSGLNISTPYEPLTADERVDIAIQADGRKIRDGYWQISLKKERKIRRLTELLNLSSYKYTSPDYKDKRGYTNFFIHSPNASKRFDEMFPLPMFCDRARDFVQEILHWDGHTTTQNTCIFGTTIKENADFVSAICAQCGIATYIGKEVDNRKESYKNYFRVFMRDSMTHGVTMAKKELIDFDGPTYCVSVPSTMFVARKDGYTFITGNTELISNSNYYTARRFLIESSNTKLVELGNPLTLGHFKDVYDDDSTFVVHMNDVTSILEGRMSRKDFELTLIPKHTQEYKSFIQCEFPSPEQGDGFFSTMPKSFLDLPDGKTCTKISFMGIDSAYKGADGLVVTIINLCRAEDGTAWVELAYQEDLKERHPRWGAETTMQIALDILTLAHKYNVIGACIDIAFGIHVFEMIQRIEDDFPIEPVNFGNKPTESRKEIFYSATWAYNLRAEMHLDVKELCENNFLYIDNKYFDQMIREMREIRLENELGKIKVENKSKIKSRLGASPDHLDSLCLAVRAMVMSGAMGGTLDDSDGIAYIEG